MYKYLLCWRYLRTRYIALASVVSVMLGVATMIVVNSVMAGFADKMRDRIHGILADIVVESNIDGFVNVDEVMLRITGWRRSIVAMALTMEAFGLMKLRSAPVDRRQVRLSAWIRSALASGDFSSPRDDKERKVPPRSTFEALRMNSRAERSGADQGYKPDASGYHQDDLMRKFPTAARSSGSRLGTYRRKG